MAGAGATYHGARNAGTDTRNGLSRPAGEEASVIMVEGAEPAVTGERPREGRRFPLGVAIASVVAGLILVALLLPQVLLYPDEPVAPPAPDYDAQLALLQAHNEAMQDEVSRLETLLGSGVCRLEDGTLNQPGTAPGTAPGAAPGTTPGPAPAPGTAPAPAPGSNTLLEIPLPSLAQATPSGGGDPVPLPTLLDSSVALVLVQRADGVATGSAVAVAPGYAVTNFHVVEGATEIWLASHALSQVQPVTVMATLGGGALGEQDYALLVLPAGSELRPLAFATAGPAFDRLTPVVAAGYPGMLLNTDEQFKSLVHGDAQAVPQLVLTQGIVTVVQEGGSVPLVVHSAQLSPGSSGGPLVDLCGRVLGLNTFVTSDQTAAHVNYALSGTDLGLFLQQSGVTPATQDGACLPQQVATTSSTTTP